MKIRLSRLRRFATITGNVIIMIILFGQQAEAAQLQRFSAQNDLSSYPKIEKIASVQQDPSSPFISRAPLERAFLEIVQDLPHIYLKNSLSIWINDYAQDPFSISHSIHFP